MTKSSPKKAWIKGRRFRLTKLDNCAAPIVGAGSVLTSKGFVSVNITTNTADGTEITLENASGERDAYQPATPEFLGHTVELVFTKVDPEAVAIMTGNRVVVNHSGEVIGFTTDTAVIPSDAAFALEVWAGVQSDDGCAQASATPYGYMLLPFLTGGTLGDITVENGAVNFTVSNATTKDGNAWGTGLFNTVLNAADEPSLLAEALSPTEPFMAIETFLSPPEVHHGARPFLPVADPEVTDGGAVATNLSVDFDPVTVGSYAFWIDFGDGYWDYSADGSTLNHVYEAAGTYTFTVYRGTSSFTDTITVTA